ncbi:UvrD-helicase domain-containing protein [Halobacteriovorax sp. HLS]|uniref:UvrD-helicase domain-containing protein n=1 Tax=Halobacteriovorax sp. HLS TaxID=2234000 RepID=UPI000FDAEB51|nr:UvrD-helicase domain-containing protein [Halobacteriovorax sp. HLS]
MENIKIAISDDFFTAYSKLPQGIQKRTREFMDKFRFNPKSPGLNYEVIRNTACKDLRSVRINQEYRAIVLEPSEGSVYLLLWVDKHDDAYSWAMKKNILVNSYTGTIQILDTEEIERLTPKKEEKEKRDDLFSGLKDKQLLRLGVPEPLVPAIRAIKTESELDTLIPHLPSDVSEVLYLLASGYSEEEVHLELLSQNDDVDTEDYSAALDVGATRKKFYVVEDESELLSMLNAPMDKWRVFLHPYQRKLVEMNASGPVRVLGGAGTGKTVVAIHRAKHLAENIFKDEKQKILFTTFTRNLAADIENNLRKIASADVCKKIEVVSVDQWVMNFLKREGYKFKLVFDNSKEWNEAWQCALNVKDPELNLSDQFFKDEWKHIIQAKDIKSFNEYSRVRRIGRGQKVDRATRKLVWEVFEEYRAILDDKGLKEVNDCINDSCNLLSSKGDVLPYAAVIVDEAQDMNEPMFKLVRAISGAEDRRNNIFIVGDGHQKIYSNKVVLSHCGINIKGRSKKLKINYRTTDEIRKWSVSLLEDRKIDDLDGGEDNNRGYKSLMFGSNPTIEKFPTYDDEIYYIAKYINELLTSGVTPDKICLVARTNSIVEDYKLFLADQGLEIHQIQRRSSEDSKERGVRVATIHRVKGLEFEHVIISSVNDGVIPLEFSEDEADTPFDLVENETTERSLLYVAATRAKKSVLITSYGNPSKFLS